MDVFIYSLTDPRTKEIRYVGKAIDMDKRFYGHMLVHRSNTHKSAWIKSLKRAGLKPEMDILETIHDSDDTDWQESERWWISYLRMIGCALTNQVDGGHGGRRASAETRAKQSAGIKRHFANNPEARAFRSKQCSERRHSPETIEKMRRVQSNRSPETLAKMKAAAKARGRPKHWQKFAEAGWAALRDPKIQQKRIQAVRESFTRRAALKPPKPEKVRKMFFGKHTEETKKRLSDIAKAQWASKESRNKIQNAIRRKHSLPEIV